MRYTFRVFLLLGGWILCIICALCAFDAAVLNQYAVKIPANVVQSCTVTICPPSGCHSELPPPAPVTCR